MTADTTIIIPTAGRPEYLRQALFSVRDQTARDRLAEIKVSENLGDRRSEEVCKEFADLPITYILRDPQLGHPRHLGQLATEPATRYTALLNDDDWWSPGHLSIALRAMDARPDVSGWYTGSIWTDGESLDYVENHRYPALRYFAEPSCHYLAAWEFSPAAVLSLCWMYAPFHWSSLVARTDFLIRSTRDLETESAWNADRVLIARLACFGPTLFHPVPQTWVRLHGDNWAMIPAKFAQVKAADAVWRDKAREIAGAAGVDVQAEWKKILPLMSAKDRAITSRIFRRLYQDQELIAMGFAELVPSRSRKLRQKIKPLVENWVPPAILRRMVGWV